MPAGANRTITIKVVDALSAGESIWDKRVPGFRVRKQTASGKPRYEVRYKVDGKWKQVTIGPHGTWTPETAREEARRIQQEAARGTDIKTERERQKAASTFDELCRRFEIERLPELKPSTQHEYRRLMKKRLRPEFAGKKVERITESDIERLRDKLRDTRTEANRAIQLLSRLMSLAERWGMRPRHSNPCTSVERFRENIRNRYATDAELRAIAQVLDRRVAAGTTFPGVALAIKLAALTGLRLGEIRRLKWDDIDPEHGVIVLLDSKTGFRHHATGSAAFALLEATECSGPYIVWTTDPKQPAPQGTIENQWSVIREEAGCPDLHFHDLRHSYGTFAGQTGANAFLIRDALGHRTLAMSGRYVNAAHDPLCDLANKITARVSAAFTGEPAGVRALEDEA